MSSGIPEDTDSPEAHLLTPVSHPLLGPELETWPGHQALCPPGEEGSRSGYWALHSVSKVLHPGEPLGTQMLLPLGLLASVHLETPKPHPTCASQAQQTLATHLFRHCSCFSHTQPLPGSVPKPRSRLHLATHSFPKVAAVATLTPNTRPETGIPRNGPLFLVGSVGCV